MFQEYLHQSAHNTTLETQRRAERNTDSSHVEFHSRLQANSSARKAGRELYSIPHSSMYHAKRDPTPTVTALAYHTNGEVECFIFLTINSALSKRLGDPPHGDHNVGHVKEATTELPTYADCFSIT
jgi:hypothetical protein